MVNVDEVVLDDKPSKINIFSCLEIGNEQVTHLFYPFPCPTNTHNVKATNTVINNR